MSGDLRDLADHCRRMATRDQQARPAIAADVADGILPASHLATHDRTTALWQQLADEIDTHLTPSAPAQHPLEEPLWETT